MDSKLNELLCLNGKNFASVQLAQKVLLTVIKKREKKSFFFKLRPFLRV